MRIPTVVSLNPRGSVLGVTSCYDARELGHVPLGAQIMGSNVEYLELAARVLVVSSTVVCVFNMQLWSVAVAGCGGEEGAVYGGVEEDRRACCV
jgi:hypothetical protein